MSELAQTTFYIVATLWAAVWLFIGLVFLGLGVYSVVSEWRAKREIRRISYKRSFRSGFGL